ncbi:MAG TPA: hypothetical protein PKB02_02230 [Anaerohalosphaeraceae bacterium]|nr:hypothetical protein [Anaerohalosphaeraceae bacterium]
MSGSEKTNSLKEIIVEQARDWLEERKSFWLSPDSTSEICTWQTEIYQLTEDYYDKRKLYEMIDDLTSIMAKVFIDLGRISISEWHRAEDIMNIFVTPNCPCLDEVRETINAKLIIHSGFMTDGSAERLLNIFKLLSILIPIKPSNSIMRVIHNIVKSYAAGLDAECISLCLTAIELTLKEKVSAEMLSKNLGPRQSKYDISDRLAVAVKDGMLTETTRKMAGNVRVNANQIKHEDVSLTQKVDNRIDETCHVIYNLYSGKDYGFGLPEDILKILNKCG